MVCKWTVIRNILNSIYLKLRGDVKENLSNQLRKLKLSAHFIIVHL